MLSHRSFLGQCLSLCCALATVWLCIPLFSAAATVAFASVPCPRATWLRCLLPILAAELESLPPATLYLTLSKLSTKGLRLLLDESISVVSDRLNAGDSAVSKLKDLLHVKAEPVGTSPAPASARDMPAPAADSSEPPALPPAPAAAEVSGTGLAPAAERLCPCPLVWAGADGSFWRLLCL